MLYLGMDVGGTEVKFGLINEVGEVLKSNKIPTKYDKEEFLKSLVEIAEEFKKENKIEGIALSFPGFINYKTGELIRAGALTFLHGFNIKEYLEKETNLIVHVENDVNTVAMAEKLSGNATECEDFICMTIGTGIGGGVYFNNSLIRGKNFGAGEFGFVILNSNSDTNNPHERSLSASVAVGALRKRYAEQSGMNIEDVTGYTIFDGEDEIATSLREEFFRTIALFLFNTFYSFNPEKILIGGAISKREDLIPKLKVELDKLIHDRNIAFNVDTCKHGNDAGMIGAVAHFIAMEKNK